MRHRDGGGVIHFPPVFGTKPPHRPAGSTARRPCSRIDHRTAAISGSSASFTPTSPSRSSGGLVRDPAPVHPRSVEAKVQPGDDRRATPPSNPSWNPPITRGRDYPNLSSLSPSSAVSPPTSTASPLSPGIVPVRVLSQQGTCCHGSYTLFIGGCRSSASGLPSSAS